MPALPNAAKVIRVDLFQTVNSDVRARDRIYFAYAGAGPAVVDLNTLGGTIGAAWGANLKALQQSNSGLTQLELTDLTSATGAQTIVTSTQTGTRAGGSIPSGAAAVIRFKIARRYRGGHPRLYFAAGSNTDVAATGSWTGAYVTALQSAWAAFIAACILAPPAAIGAMTHINLSYFLGFTNKTFPSGRTHPVPTLRATPVQDVVLSYSVNPLMASQRRRNLQSP